MNRLWVVFFLGIPGFCSEPVLDIGADRQLFVSHDLIASMSGVRLVLHQPVRREIAIRNENPWEKHGVSYMAAFKDGDRFRAWYRCDPTELKRETRRPMTAYAESLDGVVWAKPELGIIEFGGSRKNNLVWDGPGSNMAVFKDENPRAPPEERYKAIVRSGDLLALASPDGLHWRLLSEDPILTERPFDSHNIVYWDTVQERYVLYARGVRRQGEAGHAMSKSFKEGVRCVRRATSNDFTNWSDLELIDLGDAPLEHLYTNAAIQYPRAPGFTFLFPSRFVDTRKPDPEWAYPGVNDIVFLSSRDGFRFDRTFLEAFVRPGLDQGNWSDRALYMERGILETSPTELSLYAMENWRRETVHIRRLTLRPDGFASIQASHEGGEMRTKPFRFQGSSLFLNFSTSAVGEIRVELSDEDGNALEGYTLDECPALYGDSIDRRVEWSGTGGPGKHSGRPVRLKFFLRDADLFAFRFE